LRPAPDETERGPRANPRWRAFARAAVALRVARLGIRSAINDAVKQFAQRVTDPGYGSKSANS
jgi:hypothetical protein